MTDFLDECISQMWFQYDGIPVHKSLKLRAVLPETIGNNIVGYRSPIKWPPRSLDLNHLYYFFWFFEK